MRSKPKRPAAQAKPRQARTLTAWVCVASFKAGSVHCIYEKRPTKAYRLREDHEFIRVAITELARPPARRQAEGRGMMNSESRRRMEREMTRPPVTHPVGPTPTPSPAVARAEALKPCPFCGGTDINPAGCSTSDGDVAVCGDCGADGPHPENKHNGTVIADGAEMWNRRAESPPAAMSAAPAAKGEAEKAAAFDALEVLARERIMLNIGAPYEGEDGECWMVHCNGGPALPTIHGEGPTLSAAVAAAVAAAGGKRAT